MEREDITECLTVLAEGDEEALDPRIKPTDFEKWYREYFDEPLEEEDDEDEESTV